MDSVYKINYLCFNNSKKQFCLCHNNGIKNYETDDFKLLYTSAPLGSISFSALIHELNMAVLVGAENNEEFNDKKLAIYDLINKKKIYSTAFLNKIVSIKIIDKYLIISFEFELKIYSLEKKDTIMPISEIPLPTYDTFGVWEKDDKENSTLTKLFIVYTSKKSIYFKTILGNGNDDFEVKAPVSKIQNLFYIPKLNQIFLPDETAYYIYSINSDDGKQVLCLYRGKNPGYITSITLLNKNYLAVNNLNRTIHIFDLNEKGSNLRSMIGNFIYGNYISPMMRIKYNQLVKKNEKDEGQFFEDDFAKKGALLLSEEDGTELRVIAYNGYAYKIRINFLKKDIASYEKKSYCSYQIDDMNEETTKKESGEIKSFNSIFEKETSQKKDDKFVVIK